MGIEHASARPGKGLTEWFNGMLARLLAARTRRADARALAAMSDGELADMRISRSDVIGLFDAKLAQECRSRRTTGGRPSRATPGLTATVARLAHLAQAGGRPGS